MIAEQVDGRITVWSKRIGLILLGWFASSAYHGTLTAKKAEIALPAIQAEAGCERWRAGKAISVAKQAIKGANSDTAPIPDIKAIPKDCAHPQMPKQ